MTTENENSDSDRDVARRGLSRRGFVAAGTTAVGAMTIAQSALAAGASKQSDTGRSGRTEHGLPSHCRWWSRPAATLPATTKGPDGKTYPDLYAATAAQYATNEAIPRMLDTFERRGIKMTSMLCGKFCEQHPDLAKEIAQRGHECAAHGYTHSNQYNMSRDDEHAFIQQAVDAITKSTGQRPLGYNCRGQLRSANTLSIEQELGFHLSHRRHQPRRTLCRPVNGKPFAVVPYTQHLGDIGYFNNRGSAIVFNQEMKYEFDALYAEAETRRRLMVVTIHNSIARASRVKAFDDFIAYAQRHKGVWFARADELAHWALESPNLVKETTAT